MTINEAYEAILALREGSTWGGTGVAESADSKAPVGDGGDNSSGRAGISGASGERAKSGAPGGQRAVRGNFSSVKTERVELLSALGRVLAEPVSAIDAAPRFSNSAMDGYAVAGCELGTWRVAGGTVYAGDFTPRALSVGECCKIMTGALLPEGADAVLMVENAELLGASEAAGDGATANAATETVDRAAAAVKNTSKPLKPGENIRHRGEEYPADAQLLAPGKLLGAADLMLAAANGRSFLEVAARPNVGVFASGDELLEPYERGAGVYNCNATGICALASGWANARILGTLRDDAAATERALCGAAEAFDLVITIGAASVGDADYVKSALERAGFCAVFSRVQLKPGGPVGLYARGSQLVLTLPGNPMSAHTCMRLFAPALAALLLGQTPSAPQYAPLAQEVKISGKKENVIYGRLNERGEFVPHNGGRFSSGQLTPMVSSTHFARVFAGNAAGELVQVTAIY